MKYWIGHDWDIVYGKAFRLKNVADNRRNLMREENNHQNLLIGAAVVAGVLGTLSALMRSNHTVHGWTAHARDAANHMMEGDMVNKNLLLGGVAGGLIGAAAALLLAPKAGSELIEDITHTLIGEGEHKRRTSRRSSSRRSSSSRRKASHSGGSHAAAHGEHGKAEGKSKTRRSSGKKRSSARRRTATAAHKPAVSSAERSSEVETT
jgi:gas vesicle protein